MNFFFYPNQFKILGKKKQISERTEEKTERDAKISTVGNN